MRRVLCICNGGNVRSVALARYIKDLNGIYINLKGDENIIKYEAVAIGKDVMTKNSIDYMRKWADIIIDVSDDGEYSIGRDIWNDASNPNLIKKMEEVWRSVEEHL